MYGHIEVLAKEIQKGANSVAGVEATLYQVSTLGCVLVKSEPILEGVCYCWCCGIGYDHHHTKDVVVVPENFAFTGARDLAP